MKLSSQSLTANIDDDRGSPSIMASSPTMAPGPSMAKIRSSPCGDVITTLSRACSSRYQPSPGSPATNSASPAGRRRDAAFRKSCAERPVGRRGAMEESLGLKFAIENQYLVVNVAAMTRPPLNHRTRLILLSSSQENDASRRLLSLAPVKKMNA